MTEREVNGQRSGAAGDRLDIVAISEVEREAVRWLWPGRIPLGKTGLVEGHPGLGKSTLLLDLAARVSRDGRMPDGSQGVAGPVVILTGEDGLADTVRPRLEVAGANLDRVHAIRGLITIDNEYREVELPEHIRTLGEEIDRCGAVLVIVDPLSAFLSDSVNTWRDHDVRRVLRPLAVIAEQTGAAVQGVRHLVKSVKTAITAGQGSIAFSGAARSVYLVASDPEDESGEARLLLSVKNNLALAPPTLRYRLVPCEDVARIEWIGVSEQTAAAVLAAEGGDSEEREATTEAARWLADYLTGDRKVDRKAVLDDGRRAGFGERALERAAKKLRVHRHRSGLRQDHRSLWSLPAHFRQPHGRVGSVDSVGSDGSNQDHPPTSVTPVSPDTPVIYDDVSEVETGAEPRPGPLDDESYWLGIEEPA
jgi:hypothetical protein